MAKKKLKEVIENKAIKPVSIDWNKVEDGCIIISLGNKHMMKGTEYKVTKEMAQILVNKGAAKLK
jgi:hypothetical protein